MSASLDRLIADRLGISEDHAQTLLRAMLRELRSRAEEEGVRLPELGTFREEEGTLTFSPSKSLRRLVNREYEGLGSQDISPEAERAADETASAPPFPAEPGDRFESEPVGGRSEAPDDGAAEKPATEEPTAASGADAGDREASAGAAAEASPRTTRPTRTMDSFHLIVAFLLFLLFIGTGWFVLSETGHIATGPAWLFSSGSTGGSGTQTAMPAADTTLTQTASPDTAAAAALQPTPPDTASEEQAGIDAAAGGWTIVVASPEDTATAESTAQTYTERFADVPLPVDVLPTDVENTTRYRVCVGQYQNRDSVIAALETYGSRLPDGAWVLRLR